MKTAEQTAEQIIDAAADKADYAMNIGDRVARMLALAAELAEHMDYMNMDTTAQVIAIRDDLADALPGMVG